MTKEGVFVRKFIFIIFFVIMAILCLSFFLIMFKVFKFSSVKNDSEEIVVNLYEKPTRPSYTYEILDKGIIELKEIKKEKVIWQEGYNITWFFRILSPGIVRIKWTTQDDSLELDQAKGWIDTYTIYKDYSYSLETQVID